MNRLHFTIVTVLSLAIAVLVYCSSPYKSSSLVIEATVLQKGLGIVEINGDTPGQSKIISFEINGDTGKEGIYPVELPATRVTTIKLAPLSSRDSYELGRITLANDSVSYSWDGQGTCVQKSYQNNTFKQGPCGEGSPKLTIAGDSSVVISSIPNEGSINTFRTRVVTAAVTALLFCVCGIWLLWPCSEAGFAARLTHRGVRLLWLVVAVLYFYQFYLIWKYSVDVPFYEEWEYFGPQALSNELSLEWLFSFSGLHRVVFTKLIAWLSLKMTGLDFALLKMLNYLIFGALLLAIARFKDRVVGRDNFKLFPAFMIFLLSPIAYENHVFAYQSQIHLVLLLSVVTLYVAYLPDITYRSTLIFSLGTVLAMFTFSSGVGIAGVYVLCRTIYIVAHVVRRRLSRIKGLLNIFMSWFATGAGFFLWLQGYAKPALLPRDIYPTDIRFWDCFLNLVSLGFGVKMEHMIPGIAFLGIAVFPVILLLKGEGRWRAATWQVLTATIGVLCVLAMISMGRGTLSGASKASRYAEFAFMLIPFASLAWWLVLKDRIRRSVALSLLWGLCMACYSNDWSSAVYHDVKQMDLLTRECIERYTSGDGDGACPVTYPFPIGKYIDRAKELNVTFVRPYSYR